MFTIIFIAITEVLSGSTNLILTVNDPKGKQLAVMVSKKIEINANIGQRLKVEILIHCFHWGKLLDLHKQQRKK